MKVIFTVNTVDGRQFESIPVEDDEKGFLKTAGVLCDLKNLKNFNMNVLDALGRPSKIFFNPDHIVSVVATEETLP
jgi:hypothetical protein